MQRNERLASRADDDPTRTSDPEAEIRDQRRHSTLARSAMLAMFAGASVLRMVDSGESPGSALLSVLRDPVRSGVVGPVVLLLVCAIVVGFVLARKRAAAIVGLLACAAYVALGAVVSGID
ncbi:MAG: hypothetical protein KDC14_00500 [Planctomycetes bacterium]|nr:hypothetical protein [Planctomycetota bacterium]